MSRASSNCSALRRKVVTCFSQGVNQSAQGTDKVNSIINCHLATGRIGTAGRGAVLADRPAQRYGWPRGRRAGQSAGRAHGICTEEIDRVGRFWNAPNVVRREGLKAVQMFEAIERGEIKSAVG